MTVPKSLAFMAALLPVLACAAPTTVTFSAVTESVIPGTGFPEVGTTITGAVTFDYDLSPLSIYKPDSLPSYTGYEYAGAPILWTAVLEGTTFSHPYLGVEVFDNDSQTFPSLGLTDAVLFSTKRANVSYSLQLFGPTTSFSGSGIPSAGTLEGFWNSGVLLINDYNRVGDFTGLEGFTVLSASVSSISVSAVPEPQAYAMMFFGVGLVVALVRRHKQVQA